MTQPVHTCKMVQYCEHLKKKGQNPSIRASEFPGKLPFVCGDAQAAPLILLAIGLEKEFRN